jgi:hypothetical protein
MEVGAVDQDKRQLRKLKREVKRAGSRHRRRDLKRDLAENPGEAHRSDESFGRCSSQGLNGLDRDATRRSSSDEPAADG